MYLIPRQCPDREVTDAAALPTPPVTNTGGGGGGRSDGSVGGSDTLNWDQLSTRATQET